MTEDTRRQALSFGPAAAAYDRFRPGYPAEAVEWAVGNAAPPVRVVDLGAGTGLLSRGLLELGHQVVPVEPDEEMRAQLARATPGTTALAGSAEQIPLPDAEADAVVAGQAYHWFDPERAHAEVARVLQPGGTFAVLWNERDAATPWVAALSRLANQILGERGAREEGPASFGTAFDPTEHVQFRHTTWHTADTLVGMIATRSYYLTADPSRRREMDDAIRDLVATHPHLAGRDRFELPYRTEVYRARRR